MTPFSQPRKRRLGNAKYLSSSQGWGWAASVPKSRALSPSPLTAKILDTNRLCPQRARFVPKLSLLPSAIRVLWDVVQDVLYPKPQFPHLCCVHESFHFPCFFVKIISWAPNPLSVVQTAGAHTCAASPDFLPWAANLPGPRRRGRPRKLLYSWGCGGQARTPG